MEPNYFTVISPLQEHYDVCEKYVKDKFVDSITTKELGKNGTHPHLNIIYESDVKETDKLTRRIKRHLMKLKVPNHKNLVVTKRITDFQSLLDYVTKESDFTWIFVDDETKAKQELRNKQKSQEFTPTRWKRVINAIEFPHFAVWFINHHQNYNLCQHYINQTHIQAMLKEGYYVGHLLRKLKDLSFVYKCITEDFNQNGVTKNIDFIEKTFL